MSDFLDLFNDLDLSDLFVIGIADKVSADGTPEINPDFQVEFNILQHCNTDHLYFKNPPTYEEAIARFNPPAVPVPAPFIPMPVIEEEEDCVIIPADPENLIYDGIFGSENWIEPMDLYSGLPTYLEPPPSPASTVDEWASGQGLQTPPLGDLGILEFSAIPPPGIPAVSPISSVLEWSFNVDLTTEFDVDLTTDQQVDQEVDQRSHDCPAVPAIEPTPDSCTAEILNQVCF
jgi:hypothetical protein